MIRVLHAHRDGKYAAIDNRDAVVIDYDARMIRRGLDRWTIHPGQHFRFLALMFRSADMLQAREAIGVALGNLNVSAQRISDLITASDAVLTELGMTIETIEGAGYWLHTEPRKTLECCRNLAPGAPLPSRLRSTHAAPGITLTTYAKSRRRLTTSTAGRSARPSAKP